MQKFLRTLLLFALFAAPMATRAQGVSADRQPLGEDFSAPAAEWTGGSSLYGSAFVAAEAPSWQYAEYALNGLEAGHYYYAMWQARAAWMVTPEVDLVELGEATLSFDMALTANSGAVAPDSVASDKKVRLLVSVDGGAWQPLATWVGGTEAAEGDSLLASVPATYGTYTYNLAAYLGHTVRFAFYNEVTVARQEAVAIHLDNVAVNGKIRVQPVQNLAVSNVEADQVTFTFDDNVNALVSYYKATIKKDTIVISEDQLGYNLRAWQFSGLQPHTAYTIEVVTYADANTYSSKAVLNVTTDFLYTNIAEGYACDFEAEGAENNWAFANSTRNYWMFAADTTYAEDYDAESNPDAYTVNHLMWVTNNGKDNAYTVSGQQNSFVYTPLTSGVATYDVEFDWKNKGESGEYDYLMAFLAPASSTINGGNGSFAMPDGSIAISGALRYVDEMQHFSGTVSVPEAGEYMLVFAWRNDGSGGTNPPARFDNIVITPWTCYPVADLAVVDSLTTHNTLTVGFTAPEATPMKYLATATRDTIVFSEELEADADHVTFTGLQPETSYQVSIRTVCAEGDTSLAATLTAATHKACEPVTAVSVDSVTRSLAVISWEDHLNTGATYTLVVKKGNDTVATIANAVSPATVTGLEAQAAYTANVVAACNDATAQSSVNFTTACAQISLRPAETYTFVLDGISSGYYGTTDYWTSGNYNTLKAYVDGELVNSFSNGSDTYQVDVPEGALFEVVFGNSYSYYRSYVGLTVTNSANETIFDESSMSSYSNGQTLVSVEGSYCPDFTVAVEVGVRTVDGAALAWENPLNEDADHYEVYVRNNGTVVDSAVVETTSYTASQLTPSTIYDVEVKAVYADGYTVVGTANFETFGPCNAPTNFAAVATRSTITLSWEQDVEDVTNYQLLIDTVEVSDLSAVEESAFIDVEGNDGYTVTNLTPGTTYYLYFRGNCGADKSAVRSAVVATLPSVECGQSTLADGNTTSSYVPFENNWLDTKQRSQMIYPAEMLAGMEGATISQLSFYISMGYSTGAWTWSKQAMRMKMGTCEEASFGSAYVDTTGVTTVLDNAGIAYGADGIMTFTLATPFQYNGGNLFIDVEVLETGTYTGTSYYGISSSNASRRQRGSSSASNQNFLPKITFSYCKEAPACAAVAAVNVSDVDYNTATLTWARPDCPMSGYLVKESATEITDFTGIEATALADGITSYTFENLAENATHYVYVGTLCLNGDTAWAAATFQTPAFCRVAENLVAEVNGKNRALVSWQSTSETQAANFSLLLSTEALDDEALAAATATYTAIDTTAKQLEGLAYEQTYYVYVRNVCELNGADAPAPWVGPVTFTTGIEMPAVVGVAATAVRNSVTATWQRNEAQYADETAWQVAIRPVADDSTALVWQPADSMSYTFSGLAYATAYRVYVRAINGASVSDSVFATATTGINMPAVVSLAANVYRNEITATWQRNEAQNAIETAWQVAIRPVADDSSALVWEQVESMSHTFAGLEFATAYRVYVRAIDGEAMSDSVFVNATTNLEMAPVVSVRTAAKAYNYATLAWNRNEAQNAIETAWRIALFQGDSAVSEWETVTEMEQTYYYLSEVTAYTFRVAAYNAETGATSDTVSFNFSTDALPGDCLAFGTSTSTGQYFFPGYYGWQYAAYLYPMEDGGRVNAISAYLNSGASGSNATHQVWVKVVDADFAFTSSMTFASMVEGASLIYDGTGNYTSSMNGWIDYPFTSMLTVEPGQQLMVMSRGVGCSTSGGCARYERTSTATNMMWNKRADNTDPGMNTTGSVSSMRVNLKVCLANESSVVAARELAVTDVTANTATASWKPGMMETQWQYVNAAEPMTGAQLEAAAQTTTSMSVALTGLTSATSYTFYVRSADTADVVNVTYVVDTIVTRVDTIYTRENPLEPTYVSHSDTTWAPVYDTVEDQIAYSDWKHVSYTTAALCEAPAIVSVPAQGITVSSAVVMAVSDASALEFRVGETVLAGVAGQMIDTTDIQMVRAEQGDTTWFMFNPETWDYEEYTTKPEGFDDVEDEDDAWYEVNYAIVDTVYVIDTVHYFTAEFTGLAAQTAYEAEARISCGEGDYSAWSAPVSFTTLSDCNITLPYNEGFEDNSLTAGCWTVVVNDEFTSVQPTLAYGSYYPAGTSSSALEEGQYDRYLISPAFEATDSVNLYTYLTAQSNYYASDTVAFGYSTTGNAVEDFIWIDTVTMGSNGRNLYFPASVKHVAFHFYGNNGAYMYVGDANLRELNQYAIRVLNAQPEMGSVAMELNGDTLEASADYSQMAYEGSSLRLTATANEGHRFTGWNRIGANGTYVTAGTLPTVNVTNLANDTLLIATFAVNQNYIVVAANDNQAGTVAIQGKAALTDTLAHGAQVTLVATDTNANDHKSFRGWATSSNISSEIVSYDAEYTFSVEALNNLSTQRYYALFVQDSFNVAVAYDEVMGVVSGNGMRPLADTANVHLTATANYGYEFVDWKDAEGTVLTTEATLDTVSHDFADLAFTATFQKLPYFMQLAVNDETKGTATADPDNGYYLDELVLTATATAEHYHFQRWSDGTSENPYTFAITQDTVLTAFFAIDTHLVQLAVSMDGEEAQGTVSGEGYYDYGTAATIEATPAIGMEFVQWSDENTDNPRVITVENDIELTAEFDSITYQVAVNYAEAEGTVTMDEAAVVAGTELAKHYGNEFTLVAAANNGYRFQSWQDAQGNTYTGDTLTYTVSAEAEQSITALFVESGKINMTLAAMPAEGGQVSGAGSYQNNPVTYPDNNRYDTLTDFTMTATAAEHYHFLNWTSGDSIVSTEAEYTVNVFGEAMSFVANFELDTHLVKAVAEGNGTFTYNTVAADSVYVPYGTEVAIVAVPDAYNHFVGWVDAEGEVVREAADTTVTVLADMTVSTAKFALDTFYVALEANDAAFGTVTVNDEAVAYGDTTYYDYGTELTFAALPTVGYHVAGWSNGTTAATFTQTLMGNMPLTVSFDTNVYNVQVAANVAAGGTVAGAGQVKHFTSTTVSAEASNGYHFVKWVNAAGDSLTNELSFTVEPVSDTALTAVFEKNLYHFVAGLAEGMDETMGAVNAMDTMIAFQDQVTLTAVPAEGRHATTWVNAEGTVLRTETGNTTTNKTWTVTVTSDSAVYVNFAKNTSMVAAAVATAAAYNHGTATVNGVARDTIEYGDVAHFVAVADEGYQFQAWRKTNSATAAIVSTEAEFDTVYTGTSLLTLRAFFEVKQLNMVANVNDETMGSATVSAATVNYGSSVTFTATANEGYVFVAWMNGTDTVSHEVAYTVSAATDDLTLTAVFEAAIVNYSFAAAVNDETMGTATVSATEASAGETVTFTATANEGYHFVGWTYADGETASTEAIYSVEADSNLTLTAVFAINVYTMSASVNDADMGSATANPASVNHGGSVTFTATPATGYVFVKWINAAGDSLSNEASYTVSNVTSDMALTAVFGVQYFTVTLEVNDATMGNVTGAGEYAYGATATVRAIANEGYHFVSWSDGDTTSIRTIVVTEDITLTATFEQNVGIDNVDMDNVTIFANGNRIVVNGALNQTVYVFDVNGRVMSHQADATEHVEFTMPGTGVYLVKVGNAPAKRVVVMR